MAQSENIDALAIALCRFQGKLKGVKKTESNPFFKSKFADLAEILSEIQEDLHECGLAVTQTMSYTVLGESLWNLLETELMHVSGQWKSGEQILYLNKIEKGGEIYESLDAQTQGSAISYARRYGLSAILGIYQVDDDAQSATQDYKRAETNQNPRRLVEQLSVKPLSPAPSPSIDKPVSGTKVSQAEWDELLDIGDANGWPRDLIKMNIDKGKKAGHDEPNLYARAVIKYGAPNPSYIANADEVPF